MYHIEMIQEEISMPLPRLKQESFSLPSLANSHCKFSQIKVNILLLVFHCIRKPANIAVILCNGTFTVLCFTLGSRPTRNFYSRFTKLFSLHLHSDTLAGMPDVPHLNFLVQEIYGN